MYVVSVTGSAVAQRETERPDDVRLIRLVISRALGTRWAGRFGLKDEVFGPGKLYTRLAQPYREMVRRYVYQKPEPEPDFISVHAKARERDGPSSSTWVTGSTGHGAVPPHLAEASGPLWLGWGSWTDRVGRAKARTCYHPWPLYPDPRCRRGTEIEAVPRWRSRYSSCGPIWTGTRSAAGAP